LPTAHGAGLTLAPRGQLPALAKDAMLQQRFGWSIIHAIDPVKKADATLRDLTQSNTDSKVFSANRQLPMLRTFGKRLGPRDRPCMVRMVY